MQGVRVQVSQYFYKAQRRWTLEMSSPVVSYFFAISTCQGHFVKLRTELGLQLFSNTRDLL